MYSVLYRTAADFFSDGAVKYRGNYELISLSCCGPILQVNIEACKSNFYCEVLALGGIFIASVYDIIYKCTDYKREFSHGIR